MGEFTLGYDQGFNEGRVEGLEEGREEGYDRGYDDGKESFESEVDVVYALGLEEGAVTVSTKNLNDLYRKSLFLVLPQLRLVDLNIAEAQDEFALAAVIRKAALK